MSADVCFLLFGKPHRHERQGGVGLLPTVVFQEFSSEERCKSAKSRLEDSLSDAGTRLKSALDELQLVGKAGPKEIIVAYNVECLPK